MCSSKEKCQLIYRSNALAAIRSADSADRSAEISWFLHLVDFARLRQSLNPSVQYGL